MIIDSLTADVKGDKFGMGDSDAINQSYIYPDQFTLEKTKEKAWFIKRTMDYFANIAFAQYKQNAKFRRNYRLVNGEFSFDDYMSEESIQDLLSIIEDTPNEQPEVPQHLKHYSIINSPVNDMIGGLINRPFKYRVKAVDSHSVDETIDFRTQLIEEYFLAKIEAQLEGVPEEQVEQARQQMMDDMQKKMLDYTSVGEVWANKILGALKHNFKLKDKSIRGFTDFLITAQQFHHIYPYQNELGFNYKVENPSNVWYLANRNSFTTRDCWAIGLIEVLTISEIIDKWQLTAEEIEHLNSKTLQNLRNNEYSPLAPALPNPNDPLWQLTFENVGDFANGNIDHNVFSFNSQNAYTCVTAYYLSKKKIFKRTYIDEDGYIQTMFVSQDYKFDRKAGDIDLESFWINQWRTGVKIGADIYVENKALDYLDYPPIIGTVNTTRNTQAKSLVDLIKPFQILYNICLNQIWELLEKEIGVVFLGDMKLVPNKDSDDPIEMMLWNAREKGTILIDSSLENTGGPVQFNQMTRLDLSRSGEIQARIQLAQALKYECYELVGFTRQRLGTVMASESATGVNSSLQQSFAQTEPYHHAHDVVMQEVYQCLLETSQYISLHKPTSTINYLNSELESVFLSVTKDELLRKFFVFVTSYSEDRQTLEQLKQLAQPAMQNGAELSEVFELFTATSERSLKKVLDNIQKRKAQMQQQQMQQQQEAIASQERIAAEKIAAEERKYQDEALREDRNKELDRQNRLDVERLRGIANESSFSPDKDLTPLLMKESENLRKESMDRFTKYEKNRKLDQEDRKMDIKEKEIETNLKIAKTNKN
jgi:hypothetical protein